MKIRARRGYAVAAVAAAAMGSAYANAGCGDFKAAHTGDSWLDGGAGPTLLPASFSLAAGHLELVNGHDEAASIVGMWHVKFIVGTDVIDDALATWHSDGTEIMNSSKPPISQSWCMGVWKQIGHSYKLHHIAIGWTEEGAPLGPAEIRETVTVDRSGNTFTGHFTIDQYVTDESAPPVAHVEGSLQGTRVTVD